MAKKMITVTDAAERLSMTNRGIIHLIHAGKLPAERNELGRWMIGAKDVTDCARARAKAAKEAEKKRTAKKGKK